MDDFWSIARQKRCVTLPVSCCFMIWMIFSMTICILEDNNHVCPVGEVLYALQSAADDTDETRDCVFHGWVVVTEELGDELRLLLLVDEEDVVPDQFVNKVLPQFRRNLQGVHPQRQQHFDHPLHVPVPEVLKQFLLVLVHHRLSYLLTP
jgi:hypothetical protein